MYKPIGLIIAALVMLSAAAPASAQQAASPQGAAAIETKRASLRAQELNYFTNAESASSLATVQGGAYRFYGGSAGRGLILWRPPTGTRATSAYVVYGPLLAYFLKNGREAGLLGFPTSDPITGASDGCASWPATTQSQSFNASTPAAQGGRLRFTHLCLQPSGRVEVGQLIQSSATLP